MWQGNFFENWEAVLERSTCQRAPDSPHVLKGKADNEKIGKDKRDAPESKENAHDSIKNEDWMQVAF